jgi:molybdate transport system substrate-binding protein
MPFTLLLLLVALIVPATRPTDDEALTVSAAVSLSDVLEQIVAAYGRSGGGGVRLNLGPSNVLARQLVSGAPVDVFISADEEQMDVADRAGAIAAGTRVDLLGNQLAIVAAADQVSRLSNPRMLADPAVRKLAIADPAAVPAGVYARRYLERMGLWSAVSRKVVPTASARAALASVDNGAADAGIVYVTDAAAAKAARLAFVVPAADGPRIVYPVAIVAASRRKHEAARFVAFLRSAEAAAIFRRRGFIPLAPQG